MRLPQIKHTSTPAVRQAPIPRQNIAPRGLSPAGAFGKGAQKGLERMLFQFVERENQRQVQDASVKVAKQEAEFMAMYGGKEEYSLAEIDDPIFISLAAEKGFTDINEPVPAHLVFAEWRKQTSEQAVQEAAPGIRRNDLRRDFSNRQTISYTATYGKDVVASNKDQIEYQASKTVAESKEFLQKKMYNEAALTITTSSMSEERKEEALNTITTVRQHDYFEQLLQDDSLLTAPGGPAAYIKTLKDARTLLIENDQYATSHIKESTQTEFANQLQRRIATIRNGMEAKATVSTDLLRDKVKTLTAAYERNELPNTLHLNAAMEELAATGKGQAQLARSRAAVETMPYSIQMHQQPIEVQMAMMNEAAEQNTGSYEDVLKYNVMNKSFTEGQAMLKNDRLAYGRRWLGYKYDPLDPRDLGGSMARRLTQSTALATIARDPYLQFMEPGPETNMVTEMLTKGSLKNRKAAIISINANLGKYASGVYKQLTDQGVYSSTFLAGQYMLETQLNNQDGLKDPRAHAILQGAQVRETNPDFLKSRKTDIEGAIDAELKGAYAVNPAQRAMVRTAALDAFYYHAYDSQKYDEFNPIEKEDVKQAVRLAAGTLEDGPGGFKITKKNPDRTMDEWFDGLTPAAFANVDPAMYTPEEAYQLFKTGKVDPQELMDGVYVFSGKDGKLQSKGGGTFELKYTEDPVIYQHKPSIWEKAGKKIEQMRKFSSGSFYKTYSPKYKRD